MAIGCAGVLALFNSIAAWFAVFSHFASYDDEGYFISTLRSLFAGRPVYDRVETMYGPLYYCYQWCAHVLMGTAPTSDSVRVVTVVFWTLTCLAAFWLVFRLTGSVFFGALANCFTFHAVGYLGPEHAHPQEMVLLLLLAIPLAAAGMRSDVRLAAWWGGLAGALLALKLNVGVYALVAIGMVMARGTGRRPLFLAAGAAALALPAAVMAGRLAEHWALFYWLIVTCSTAGTVALIASKKSPAPFGVTAFGACILGFVVAIAASSAFCLAHGSTAHAMFTNLVLLPRQMMGGWWFRPVPMRLGYAAPALAGAAVALYVARRGSATPGFAALKLVVAVSVLSCGAAGWWDTLLLIGAPFLWMVVVDAGATPGRAGCGSRMAMGRSTLLAVATATLLYPYPVAGSQARLAACLVVLIQIICLYDVYPALLPRLCQWSFRKRALAYGVLGCVLAAVYCRDVWTARNEYRSYSPLGFEGAARMRVEPEQAALLRSMIANVPASCDLMLTAPGMSSINLWAQRPAPQRLVIRTFTGAEDRGEQDAIIREMSSHPGSCVIFNGEQASFWSRGHDLSRLPLIRFIEDRYAVRWQGGGYQVRVAN